jgi:predicted amidohydrolase
MSGEAFTVACVQNCAGIETEPNLKDCAELVREAAGRGAAFILLPEYFTGLDIQGQILIPEAFAEADHPALPLFAGLAREHRAWILLGSLAITLQGGPGADNPGGGERIANRSYLLDPDGSVAARYDKIHLFDVDLPGGESYRESATIAPGACATVADLPWGRVGLSICYDLRFAQLYRALAKAGADFLTVPAAFTETTGRAHWHVLLRARAIETGCYVFAPCQYGVHAGDRATYGHSLIIDPWGQVLADGGEDRGVVVAEVDPAAVGRARGMVPALQHDQAFDLAETGALARAVGED